MENESENTIRNIVKEIIRECHPRNIKFHENFVTYYVKLLSLNPNWGISANVLTNRADVQKFVRYVVNVLQFQDVPAIVSLRMQFYFNCYCDNKDEAPVIHKENLWRRLTPLLNDISDAYIIDHESTQKVYKKMVYYVTLASGMGNPTVESVYAEALAALKSVVFEDELIQFTKCSKKEKERQLKSLVKLVCGIRLFNKDCEKGGEGIEDVPSILSKALEETKNELQTTLLQIMDIVNLFTSVIDESYELKQSKSGFIFVAKTSSAIDSSIMVYLADMLIMYRQYELYIRKLLVEIENFIESANKIFMDLQCGLKKIHSTVYMKIAIPATIIFPLFEELSGIWSRLQNIALMVTRLNQVMFNLRSYIKIIFVDRDRFESMLGPNGVLTDAERLQKTADLQIGYSKNPKVRIRRMESFENLDKVSFQILGFCPWKLIQTKGGLIPGNPSMGIAKAFNMYFVFSCIEAAESFMNDPEGCIFQILDLIRNKPQLINFLQLHDQLEQVKNIRELVRKQVVIKARRDVGVETEPGIADFAEKIPTYKWNIWDLKREALQLANLSKCKTVSTQTEKYYSRAPVRTQTYENKEKGLQTKKDNYTNVPKPSNYLFGLRGRKDDKQFIVDLTRPIEE